MRALHAQGLAQIARDAGAASARARAQGTWSTWCTGAQARLERVALESIVYIPGRGWHASQAQGAGKLAIAWERHAERHDVEAKLAKKIAHTIYDRSEAHVSDAALRRLLATHDPTLIKRGVGRIEALREAHDDPPSGWQTTVRCVEAAGAWEPGAWAAARTQTAWVAREAIEAAGDGPIDPAEPRQWLIDRARAACAQLDIEVAEAGRAGQARALQAVLEGWRWPEVRPPLGAALACALEGAGAPDDWGWGIAKSWEDGGALKRQGRTAKGYAEAVHRVGVEEAAEVRERIAAAGGAPEERKHAVAALERAWETAPALAHWREAAHPIRLVAHNAGQMAWYVVYASARRLALGTPARGRLGDEMERHEGVRINVGWTANQRGWSWEKRKPGDDGAALAQAIEEIGEAHRS